MSLSTLTLFDIATTAAQIEAEEWGEEAGLNLFLENSVETLRREFELMPAVCGARTGERARVWIFCGAWSQVAKHATYYETLCQAADVWIFGVADAEISIPGLVAVPIPTGAPLTRELGVVVDSPSFGAVLLAQEAGRLDESNAATRYYEGYLSTRSEVVEVAAGRLTSLLKLAPFPQHWIDHDLVTGWHSHLTRKLLEQVESQNLQLKAREKEASLLRDEQIRLEVMARGYMGGQTWDEMRYAVRENLESIADKEREEYTICFCDLVGFTKLSERLSPPEIAQILNDHFARLYQIVRAHGGTIDKFIGDAMLAYFEQPVEALEAAKKMVRESRSARVKADWSLPVQVRVGLNTGYVALANLGVPEIRQRTILGEAVNFAQRLQSAAPPHSILLSERTFAYLPFPVVRSFEPTKVEIKGRREPVNAYLWTTHADRREQISEQLSIRGSLLKTGQRASLMDRLNKRNETDG